MTVTAKTLIDAKQAANTATTEYTCPASTKTIIDKFTGTNTTAGAVTLDVHLVPSGGTADATNKIISAKSIAQDATYTCPEIVGHVLGAGDFIAVTASAATAITIRASGREVA